MDVEQAILIGDALGGVNDAPGDEPGGAGRQSHACRLAIGGIHQNTLNDDAPVGGRVRMRTGVESSGKTDDVSVTASVFFPGMGEGDATFVGDPLEVCGGREDN